MNGKKGSIEMNIGLQPPEKLDGRISMKGWILEVWRFSMEDKNRIVFSMKVGLAVLLVSLLILFRAPYQVFGSSIIWSILTVAIMFEYTVGMSSSMSACIQIYQEYIYIYSFSNTNG